MRAANFWRIAGGSRHAIGNCGDYVVPQESPDWPKIILRNADNSRLLADVRHAQGRLLGRMEALGFSLREEAFLRTLTQDVVNQLFRRQRGRRARFCDRQTRRYTGTLRCIG